MRKRHVIILMAMFLTLGCMGQPRQVPKATKIGLQIIIDDPDQFTDGTWQVEGYFEPTSIRNDLFTDLITGRLHTNQSIESPWISYVFRADHVVSQLMKSNIGIVLPDTIADDITVEYRSGLWVLIEDL